ncbi:MAG: S41 family peptidase [Chitinophagaceae bacterium]
MIIGKYKFLFAIICLIFLMSCAASRQAFDPARKIPKEKLQKDFTLFRQILEEGHPGLYWYTPKDSVDHYFDVTYSKITDTMTEPAFKTLLSYMISKINCGHTATRYSKKYARYLDTVRMKQFPLSVKFWDDSAVIYANLHRNDSLLVKGTPLTSINGKKISFYRDSLFRFLSMDGYGIVHKYQTLSNLGSFSAWYRNVFGLTDQFTIGYINKAGEEQSAVIPVFDPKKDTSRNSELINFKKADRRERRRNALSETRSLSIDSSALTGYVTLNTFMSGRGLNWFIKNSFKKIRKAGIQNLVVDVRSNGGGNVGISNLLTRYIIDHRFKLADSLYAINKRSKFGRYIALYFWHHLSMNFITRKKADGKYHFGYFERQYFNPKKSNHFNGNVYVIIGGNSFSATSLFANAVKGQKNVSLIGEETGGGAYGNTAWLIPFATLPYSGVRFTLPKFRMVVDKSVNKSGRGVMPDVFARPSISTILQDRDAKLEKVKELMREREAR